MNHQLFTYSRVKLIVLTVAFIACNTKPEAVLIPTEKTHFNSFVDCNMAECWIGDTFRIFPGKYGEDPVWGEAHDLKWADGKNVDAAFSNPAVAFKEPILPLNTAPGTPGLHGAVWFETIYQDKKDPSGKTLYAIYHNENYPATLPYDSLTGRGYQNKDWPEGLRGPATATAVCRIGVMKSTNAGRSWENKGIFIEDNQPRLILKPHNNGINFAGGVGDPSAVASGDWLYLFYGEYGYAGQYNGASYDPDLEHSGQCISIARIKLTDLDAPEGKAQRWDGKGFNAAYDGIGKPIASIQIPKSEGGGPASNPSSKYYWGPSVSWNDYLHCWVMLMARSEGTSWKGSGIYISFNKNEDLGIGNHSQEWTKPKLLLDKPGHIIWYPSLQPLNEKSDEEKKYSCLRLGEKARLFFKDQYKDSSEYYSSYIVQFKK